MHYFGTPYCDVMKMPVSRRQRMIERENIVQESRQNTLSNAMSSRGRRNK